MGAFAEFGEGAELICEFRGLRKSLFWARGKSLFVGSGKKACQVVGFSGRISGRSDRGNFSVFVAQTVVRTAAFCISCRDVRAASHGQQRVVR
jgi:hypothetical protein